MEQANTQDRYYLLVEGATQALALFSYLRAHNFPCRIAPVPHGLQASCGTSVMFHPSDREQAERLLSAHDAPPFESMVRIEKAISPQRDRFC